MAARSPAGRVPRLHVVLPGGEAADEPTTTRLDLPPPRAHYLTRVLRLPDRAEVTLLDGHGHVADARLIIDKRSVAVDIASWRSDTHTESPLQTTLGLVLSRGQRMDHAVQKSVELGVTRIDLLTSERCEVRAGSARLAHWREVAVSALEQSGRTVLPPISAPAGLREWLSAPRIGRCWLLDPGGGPAPTGSASSAITLLSGPEGGFSDREVEMALAAGFDAVRLGPRVLRTETAPLVGLTLAQLLAGDLR